MFSELHNTVSSVFEAHYSQKNQRKCNKTALKVKFPTYDYRIVGFKETRYFKNSYKINQNGCEKIKPRNREISSQRFSEKYFKKSESLRKFSNFLFSYFQISKELNSRKF